MRRHIGHAVLCAYVQSAPGLDNGYPRMRCNCGLDDLLRDLDGDTRGDVL